MIPEINIEDFSYDLPEDRIAKYPLQERDSSKLLVYNKGSVHQKTFRQLPSELPSEALMVFNDTRVVPARLFFRRDTGAHIEVFCLKPDTPSEYSSAFNATSCCRWTCVIGNAKRLKTDETLSLDTALCTDERTVAMKLKARLISRTEQAGTVEFSWASGIAFSEVLELCGQVPIPPYLNRQTEAIDKDRYQTLYAHINGSVAAPTAGLHFTERVLSEIREKGIDIENVCLHVGAGTFLPVKTKSISSHTMHREPFSITKALLQKIKDNKLKLIAVGTTSVRTLESLYYVGVSCIEDGEPCMVAQWAPYERTYTYSREESLQAIIDYLEKVGKDELEIETRIIIVPGFKFRFTDMIITNFHQPQSTLLLLVSAFVAGDWKTIYNFALSNGFRFLSYGDSSLLYRTEE